MVEPDNQINNQKTPVNNSWEPVTEIFRGIWFEIWYKPVLSIISRYFFE